MKTQLSLLFILCFAFSCTGSDNKSRGYESEQALTQEAITEDYQEEGPEGGSGEMPEKKIIRTADMRMEVMAHTAATADIKAAIQAQEGEIFRQDERQYGSEIQHQMTVKLPPKNLEPLISELEEIASYVDQKSIEAEDVTRRYIDLETRLANKRAVIKRYQELLDKAKTVEEIITVEENLRKVVEEVESMEGQFKYLQQQISRSTLHLTYYERLPQATNTRSFGSRIVKGFANGWHLLKDLTIGLVTIWPILLILILGVVFFIRRRRKRRSS